MTLKIYHQKSWQTTQGVIRETQAGQSSEVRAFVGAAKTFFTLLRTMTLEQFESRSLKFLQLCSTPIWPRRSRLLTSGARLFESCAKIHSKGLKRTTCDRNGCMECVQASTLVIRVLWQWIFGNGFSCSHFRNRLA